jgi:2-polyprenyl-6-methoxyphenol hydroxylase-like FAD-dependent oxidoreductase
MDIAIFGAGIAGLMAAITLHADGHRCRIFERQSQLPESGMGFILTQDGMNLLNQFHVPLDWNRAGMSLDRYYHRDTHGEVLGEEQMPDGAVGICRHDLVAALRAGVQGKVELSFGKAASKIELDERQFVRGVEINSGEKVTADLYVGSDGVNSRARQALYPEWPAQPGRVMEVVGLSGSTRAIQWAGKNFNKFHAVAGSIAIGVLPVNGDQIVWYAQFDADTYKPPQLSATSMQSFVQQLVGDWADPIPEMLATTDFSRAHLWRTVDSDMIPSFNANNLVLCGDAAHPLLPFTSRGVSSALADAVVLARVLRERRPLLQSLTAYSKERRGQCASYVSSGRDLMRKFLAPQNAANTFLPIA